VSLKVPLVTVIPVPALTVGFVPNPLPLMVTLVLTPINPRGGEMLLMLGFTLTWAAPPAVP
jgi:hypothetical protein